MGQGGIGGSVSLGVDVGDPFLAENGIRRTHKWPNRGTVACTVLRLRSVPILGNGLPARKQHQGGLAETESARKRPRKASLDRSFWSLRSRPRSQLLSALQLCRCGLCHGKVDLASKPGSSERWRLALVQSTRLPATVEACLRCLKNEELMRAAKRMQRPGESQAGSSGYE